MKQGDKFMYGKRKVTVLGPPDSRHRVPVSDEEGNYNLVKTDKLTLVPEKRYRYWWNQGYLCIQEIAFEEGREQRIQLPESEVKRLLGVIASRPVDQAGPGPVHEEAANLLERQGVSKPDREITNDSQTLE